MATTKRPSTDTRANRSASDETSARKAKSEAEVNSHEYPPGPSVPPGLDGESHAREQTISRQADTIRERMFPVLLADALGYGKCFEPRAFAIFLDRLFEDAGHPTDPVERMLIEQLALAHYRIAQLHVSAAGAQSVEAAKTYNSLAARMLGEFRRTALAVRICRTRHTDHAAPSPLRLHKIAE